jgi:A/G-specific adenine glycosylase
MRSHSKGDTSSLISRNKKVFLVKTILRWGGRNRRDFPWRKTRSPFQIFVAETLVQRTRAAQAAKVYTKFLENWPDSSSLAKASLSNVRSVISPLGLGYRAERLTKISKEIQEKFGGRIPDSLAKLRTLYGKGFGDYMAHAILCFAFNQSAPVVDANVERILKRVFSIKTRKNGHRDRKLWELAGSLVPSGRAKQYNWALIDFGALVCTATSPKCPICPLLQICDFGRARSC